MAQNRDTAAHAITVIICRHFPSSKHTSCWSCCTSCSCELTSPTWPSSTNETGWLLLTIQTHRWSWRKAQCYTNCWSSCSSSGFWCRPSWRWKIVGELASVRDAQQQWHALAYVAWLIQLLYLFWWTCLLQKNLLLQKKLQRICPQY